MGQYYYVVNLDKKEYLHPHRFGGGLKLIEIAASEVGVMTGLTLLLADGNGRGGGDIGGDSEFSGRWAGDRIVIAGDYADDMSFVDDEMLKLFREKEPDADYKPNLYHVVSEEIGFKDISKDVIVALSDHTYLRNAFGELKKDYGALMDR